MRPKEDIPPDELLYKSTRPDRVRNGIVLEAAIDWQGTSVVRSKFVTSPGDARSRSRPAETTVLETQPNRFPRPITITVAPQTEQTWEMFAVDDPIDGNEPHAEIRFRMLPGSSLSNKKPSKTAQLKLAAQVAGVFSVVEC